MRLWIGIFQILSGLAVLGIQVWSMIETARFESELVGRGESLHDAYHASMTPIYYLIVAALCAALVFGGGLLIKDHNLLGGAHGSR